MDESNKDERGNGVLYYDSLHYFVNFTTIQDPRDEGEKQER